MTKKKFDNLKNGDVIFHKDWGRWIVSGKNNDVYNILGLDKFDGHVGITRFREYKNWEFDKVTIFKLQLEEVLK